MLHPVVAVIVGWLLFAAVMAACSALSRFGWTTTGIFMEGVRFKAILTALALAFMLIDRRPLRDFGFRLPGGAWYDWPIGVVLGLASGAVASAVIILSPAEGMTFMKGQALWQLVVGVWFVSSIGEEVFTRGLVQTWMAGREGRGLNLGPLRLSWPVIASGLLFGSLHLSTLLRGADLWTVCTIVCFTSFLGLVAAYYREKTSSLVLPLLIHILGNIGGFGGGVVTMIVLTALGRGGEAG